MLYISSYILNSSVEPQRLKLLRAVRKKNWKERHITDRDGDTQCLRLYTQDYFLVQCVICSHEKFPNDLYTCEFFVCEYYGDTLNKTHAQSSSVGQLTLSDAQ